MGIRHCVLSLSCTPGALWRPGQAAAENIDASVSETEPLLSELNDSPC